MDDVTMYPLDFEEFIVAVGERPELLDAARTSWESQKPLAKVYHDRLNKLLRLYLVVGGMPAAVQRYVDTKDIRQVVDEQKKILKYYLRLTCGRDGEGLVFRIGDSIAYALPEK